MANKTSKVAKLGVKKAAKKIVKKKVKRSLTGIMGGNRPQ